MAAVALVAGTAWGEATSSDAEAPLASADEKVTFVPGEVVVRTRSGGYQTRSTDAQSLDSVKQAARIFSVRTQLRLQN